MNVQVKTTDDNHVLHCLSVYVKKYGELIEMRMCGGITCRVHTKQVSFMHVQVGCRHFFSHQQVP